MKIFSITIMMVILVFSFTNKSYSTDVIPDDSFQGSYLSLNIGVSMVGDESYQGVGIEYDMGNSFSLALGRDLGDIRFEAAFSRAENDIDRANDTSGSGDVVTTGFMANIFGDFENESGVVSYVGIGLGQTKVEFNSPSDASGFLLGTKESDSDSVFTYALMAGVTFQSSATMLFDLGYKYTDTDEIEIGATPTNLKLDYTSSAITLGFRKYF